MNNINVERLSATSEATKNTPSSRFLPFSVNLTWEDGTRNRAVIRDFSSLTLAEPEEFGGKNEGPNPVEYLLTGAIGCFSITLELILSQREIKLNAYHATIEGKVDMAAFFGHIDGKKGVQGITLHVSVDADAPQNEIQDAIHQAWRQSIVFNTLKPTVHVVSE